MTVNDALHKIDTFRDGWYDPPTDYYVKKSEFVQQSLQNSAIEEIKRHLTRHMGEDPVELLENFRHRMDDWACETVSSSANFMFSVYYDVATDILDLLVGV